jgi:hypothetical protein
MGADRRADQGASGLDALRRSAASIGTDPRRDPDREGKPYARRVVARLEQRRAERSHHGAGPLGRSESPSLRAGMLYVADSARDWRARSRTIAEWLARSADRQAPRVTRRLLRKAFQQLRVTQRIPSHRKAVWYDEIRRAFGSGARALPDRRQLRLPFEAK